MEEKQIQTPSERSIQPALSPRMKLSFSLNKPKAVQQPAVPKPAAAFGTTGDDDEVDNVPSTSADRDVAVNKKLLARNVQVSKAMKKKMEAEMKVDSTVYEYDEVWDRMQEVKLRQKEIKEKAAAERQPKYIHGLLSSAATRRLDRLRAEEKMMQREREAEGDEFVDKDAFVTQAYKDQMEEVRKAEEEEKKREEMRKRTSGTSTGLSYFYRKLLEESEEKHEATVAATQRRIIGPQEPTPNLTIIKPPDYTPLSDLELARIARGQGKEVELNDDNQIVDKRELLAAGLNLSAPNTRKLGTRTTSQQTSANAESAPVHRAVGSAASRKEINERRAREIQRQLVDEKDRQAQEKQKQEDEATRRIVAKRNTEEDVQSARERYLQRKRQRLEHQASEAQSQNA